MLMGHVQVGLANGLRGDNPFSDACLIAMDYGREKIIKEDWKSIFNDEELDHVLKQMPHLDHIHRKGRIGLSRHSNVCPSPPCGQVIRRVSPCPNPPQPASRARITRRVRATPPPAERYMQ
jgi:hypothetical protein